MTGRSLASVFVSVIPDTRETGHLIQRDLSRIDTTKAGHDAGHKFGTGFSSGARSIIAGVGGIVAAAGIGRVLTESVQGFRAHNQVVAQSNAVIKSTKGAANISAKAMSDYSDALERQTKVDGDVILGGENMLATFTQVQNRAGKGNDIFNQSTKTLLDLAAATGTDAPKAAIQLGKALNDPIAGVSALSRVGVTFDAQQKKQIASMQKHNNIAGAQKIVLAELNKEFGGSAKAQGDALGAQGRLTVAWHQAQDTIGAALLPVVNQLEDSLAKKLPAAADKASKAITLGATGVHAFIGAFQEGDVTSTGFVGVMERAGVAVRNLNGGLHDKGPIQGYSGSLNTLGLGVRALIAAYQEGDVTSGGFIGAMEKIGVALKRVHDYLVTVDFHKFAGDAREVGTSLGQVDVTGFAQQLQSVDTSQIGDGLNVLGRTLGFVADHVDLLVKALPFLLAGYAAYKTAEAAANVAALAGIPIKAAQVASNFVLARSIKALATGNIEEAVATGTASASEVVKAAVTNAATASTERGTFATIASTIAQRAAAIATKIWAGVQLVLNAVMSANPIGLVVIAVAALVAGVILAYKHSDKFRAIVSAAFHDVAAAGQFMWEKVLRPTFAFIVGAWLAVAGAIVNGAAKAFGWVPGLGGRLKAAAAAFNHFRDEVNGALSGVKSRKVTVTATLTTSSGPIRGGSAFAAAAGGAVYGPGTGTSDSVAAFLSNGEHVWTARETAAAGGHLAVARMRKAALAGTKAYAGGGPVGLDVVPRLDGLARFQASIAAFNRSTDAAARKLIPPVTTGATGRAPGAVGGNAALGKALAAQLYGWTGGNWNALFNLWQGESGWNNNAQNPTSTAYGIAQFLNSTWGSVGASKTSDPGGQIRAGLRYIAQSYGNPANAYGKWLSRSPHWYDGGGWLPPGITMAMNGTSRPERIRTGAQEDALVAELRALRRDLASQPILVHLDSRPIARVVRTQNTRNPNGW